MSYRHGGHTDGHQTTNVTAHKGTPDALQTSHLRDRKNHAVPPSTKWNTEQVKTKIQDRDKRRALPVSVTPETNSP
jgi:hypothetical protein